jgi:hypothetical protein
MSADQEIEPEPPPGVPAPLDRDHAGFALGKCGSFTVNRYGPANAHGLHVYRWTNGTGQWLGCVATLPAEIAERFQVRRATQSAREVLGIRL